LKNVGEENAKHEKYWGFVVKKNKFTFRKSLNQITSGFGSPITSHPIITVSPSYASLCNMNN
jgi:hypothetical protein